MNHASKCSRTECGVEEFFELVESTPVSKKVTVLLTFPIRPEFIGPTVDLGLGALYTALRLDGFDVDLNLNAWTEDELGEYLSNNHVDVVGIKVYATTTLQTIETVEYIKKYSPDTLVVVGGPHAISDPGRILDYIPADFAFQGECEEAFPLFLTNYFKGEEHLDIDGLIYRDIENGNIHFNDAAIFKDLDQIPYPPWHKMGIANRYCNYYYRSYPNAVIMRTRGCPSTCRFCCNSFSYRERSIEHVMREIHYLKDKFGVREFVFLDNNFNANRRATKEFCRRLIDEEVKVPYNVLHGMRVNTIDEETVRLLAESGCYKVSVGVESGDQKMLDYLNKGYRVEDLPSRIGLLKKHGIEVQAFVMIGLPDETDRQRRKTFATTMKLPFDHVTYNIFTPYPGTPIFNELVENGTLQDLGYDLIKFSRTNTENRLTARSSTYILWCSRYYFLRFYSRPRKMWRTLKEFISYPDSGISAMYAFYKAYINSD